MESSGVPVVFETCETLVLLDRGRACAFFAKKSLKAWKQDEKWDEGGCSDTWKAIEKFQLKQQAISCRLAHTFLCAVTITNCV